MRYLWRAYRRGELPGWPLGEDLTPETFGPRVLSLVEALEANNGRLEVFVNHLDEPIGIVGVSFSLIYGRARAFPHAMWFKEGKPRQRVECGLRFLLWLKKQHLVVIEATAANWPYFEHLCKYGVLRRVGTLRDALGTGEKTAIYQSVGK